MTLGTAASIAVMTTLAVTTCATAPPGRGPVSLTTVGSFAAAAVGWPGAPILTSTDSVYRKVTLSPTLSSLNRWISGPASAMSSRPSASFSVMRRAL